MAKTERVPASNVSRTQAAAGSSSVESPVPLATVEYLEGAPKPRRGLGRKLRLGVATRRSDVTRR
jgi:hypothetical protein